MFNKSLQCLAGLCMLASIANAQPADFGRRSSRPIRLMLGGGASVPVSDLAEVYEAGYNVAGGLLISLPGFPIHLRTDVNYSTLRLKDLATPTGGSGAEVEDVTQLLGGLLNLTLPLGPGPVRPYVIAGLGAFRFDPAQSATGQNASSVEFAINGGAGLQLRLFGIDAFLEGRINNVYTDKGIIDRRSVQMIPVTFGVIF